ncbi:glutamate racemase [Breznakibacter xylanolyticus]|uniref:Glutamate racemase n=1 Tax=Breznakibacter xylanolyticus TaxID=990 RepID=A0A2W7NAQ1_9BACT|nr:glutamate racemase [Breznakibacter xylanolyticus]PZX17361.1 glutamate racemase [Breznakibacter xylanolyticus]
MGQPQGAIGVFDSGYGGLTVLKSLMEQMPNYDFIYLGDNARTPYGNRSFEVVYEYTLQAVEKLFDMGCHLVILACNTASAKALRTIQQKDLPRIDVTRRVLGVIRPSVEAVSQYTSTGHVGVVGTVGTVMSDSYPLEIKKLYPHMTVVQEACPMWVPLVENGEAHSPGADYFVQRHLMQLMQRDEQIDTLILGCTHYPLLIDKIRQYLPSKVTVLSQGDIVAASLVDYLHRHPDMDAKCLKQGQVQFFTTESTQKFSLAAALFLNQSVEVRHVGL